MKQHITIDQLNELNDKQIKTFLDWVFSKLEEVDRSVINNMALELDEGSANGLYVEHITIGIMIEFLDGKFINFWRGARKDWLIVIDDDTHIVKDELVDCLWEAVKYELSGVGE